MSDIISLLTDRNDKRAYANAKQIAAESEFSPAHYDDIDEFASLLADKSSYVRTRAFILICSQSRWDTFGRIKAILPSMLPLLNDDKPTVVRQCLNAVKEVIVFRPELCDEIENALSGIDLTKYKDSMTPLIIKDIKEVTELLEERTDDR